MGPGMKRRHAASVQSLHPMLKVALDAMTYKIALPRRAHLYCFFGTRGAASQNSLYRAGRSRARYGQSWHNLEPSLAMDIVPVWDDKPREVEWTSYRTRDLLSECASYADYLTWGDDLFRGDIYHFQLLPDSGPHKYDIAWSKLWEARPDVVGFIKAQES